MVVGLIANLVLALALYGGAPAPSPAPKAEILGTWKGRSICTKVEANEFCRDETVVYNVVDVPGQPQTVRLKAARIVDDTMQPTYELYFTYRPDTGTWSSKFDRPSFRGVWSYVVHGDDMNGTATMMPSTKVVRTVTVKRVAEERVTTH